MLKATWCASIRHLALWPTSVAPYVHVFKGVHSNASIGGTVLQQEWPPSPKPSVKRTQSLNGPGEQTRQVRSRQLIVLGEKAGGGKERGYIQTPSPGESAR